jgi:hypothetical protein
MSNNIDRLQINAKPKRGRGRPIGTTKEKKVPVSIMLLEATKAQLDQVADLAGVNRSVFVDETLQEKFRKWKRR